MTAILPLTPPHTQAWDDYVRRNPAGTPLQLSHWQTIIHQTYHYQTHYHFAQQNKQIVGIMPLFTVRSPLTGHYLTTLPGGLCADNPAIATALLQHACQLAEQTHAKRLVIQDTRTNWPGPFVTAQHHEHWKIDTRPGLDTLWQQLNSDTRRQVRNARKNSLTVNIGRSQFHLNAFYDVFSHFTHQAGTPVFPKAFLQNIAQASPNGYNIALVCHHDQPIGGYVQLEMGNTCYGMWGATLRQHLRLRPVYLAMWEIISDTVNNGFDFLDMGRSPAGSNASKFKGKWGGTSHPIYQQVCHLDGKTTGTVTRQIQTDPKMQLFTRLWPHLPYPLTTYLGPKLRKHIPFA